MVLPAAYDSRSAMAHMCGPLPPRRPTGWMRPLRWACRRPLEVLNPRNLAAASVGNVWGEALPSSFECFSTRVMAASISSRATARDSSRIRRLSTTSMPSFWSVPISGATTSPPRALGNWPPRQRAITSTPPNASWFGRTVQSRQYTADLTASTGFRSGWTMDVHVFSHEAGDFVPREPVIL